MDPLLLSALLSFGPGLLSGLFGDPRKKLLKKANALTSPQNLAGLTNQFYQQALASPAYTQAQNTIAQGANATQANVASHLGAAGIGSSGTGALLASLGPSLVGNQQAQLRTGAYQAGQNQAQNTVNQQLQTLMGASMNPQTGQVYPSQGQQLFAGGLSAWSPYLEKFLAPYLNPKPGQ